MILYIWEILYAEAIWLDDYLIAMCNLCIYLFDGAVDVRSFFTWMCAKKSFWTNILFKWLNFFCIRNYIRTNNFTYYVVRVFNQSFGVYIRKGNSRVIRPLTAIVAYLLHWQSSFFEKYLLQLSLKTSGNIWRMVMHLKKESTRIQFKIFFLLECKNQKTKFIEIIFLTYLDTEKYPAVERLIKRIYIIIFNVLLFFSSPCKNSNINWD